MVSTKPCSGEGYAVTSGNCTGTYFEAIDGWFNGDINSAEGSDCSREQAPASQMFDASSGDVKIYNNKEANFHVKGYDQFCIVGRDNNATESKGKYLEVYIDGVKQSMTLANTATVRTFNMSAGEHVIKVKGVGSSNNYFYAFALREADVPSVKYVKGNDTTQVVEQGHQLQPIIYSMRNTGTFELDWDGAEGTGATISVNATGDTCTLSGIITAPVGMYTYRIYASKNGQRIDYKQGKFYVATPSPQLTPADNMEQALKAGMSITPMVFDIADAAGATVTGLPDGVSYTYANGTLTISGTVGTQSSYPARYTYTVTVTPLEGYTGAPVTASGTITIIDPNAKSILYLYKTNYQSLVYSTIEGAGYGLVPQKQASAAQPTSAYASYDGIIISEDVDANNAEIINIIKTVNLPILNMSAYSYLPNRLSWGTNANNGDATNTAIKVMQPTHPIFNGLTGNSINILSEVESRGIQPADINLAGTICLATAPKRNVEGNGTAIHEVQPNLRGTGITQRYIFIGLSARSYNKINNNGKKLLLNIMSYIMGTSSASTVTLPNLQINTFSINGRNAYIDQANNRISIEFPAGTDLHAFEPFIILADAQKTFVNPDNNAAVDFTNSYAVPVEYTVTDMINTRVYQVVVTAPTALRDVNDADGIWYDGITIHNDSHIMAYLYNAAGQRIAVFNSDHDMTAYPRGIYMIATANASLKIVR